MVVRNCCDLTGLMVIFSRIYGDLMGFNGI